MPLSDFEIQSQLGEGTYSTVHKALRKADGKIYALKMVKMQPLNEKERENALNEIRILASIQHNNIIQYKEAFFENATNMLWQFTRSLVMEFANSGDLYQRIQSHQRKKKYMRESLIWSIIIQVIKGLKALHDMNILHRDIKSANIFLNLDGTVKLGDMNVSKVAKNGFLSTQTGTPYYASPEVWKDMPYNSKSDVWSLGCILYEAAALRPPFMAEDMQGLFRRVTKGQYRRLPRVYSKDLNDIIQSMLTVDANRRPSCGQLLRSQIIKRHMRDTPDENDEINFDVISHLDQTGFTLPGPNYNNEARLYKSEPSPQTGSNLPKIFPKNPYMLRQNMITPDISVSKLSTKLTDRTRSESPRQINNSVTRKQQLGKIRYNSPRINRSLDMYQDNGHYRDLDQARGRYQRQIESIRRNYGLSQVRRVSPVDKRYQILRERRYVL